LDEATKDEGEHEQLHPMRPSFTRRDRRADVVPGFEKRSVASSLRGCNDSKTRAKRQKGLPACGRGRIGNEKGRPEAAFATIGISLVRAPDQKK
jgi:hypothetical protein